MGDGYLAGVGAGRSWDCWRLLFPARITPHDEWYKDGVNRRWAWEDSFGGFSFQSHYNHDRYYPSKQARFFSSFFFFCLCCHLVLARFFRYFDFDFDLDFICYMPDLSFSAVELWMCICVLRCVSFPVIPFWWFHLFILTVDYFGRVTGLTGI